LEKIPWGDPTAEASCKTQVPRLGLKEGESLRRATQGTPPEAQVAAEPQKR